MSKEYVISVPGGLTRTGEILALKEHLKTLGKPVTLQTFDAVQGLRWNGGRMVMSTLLKDHPGRCEEFLSDATVGDLPEIVRRVRLLNDHGIAFNLTINNILESVDVENAEGNYLLEHLQNDINLVTVSTHALSRHIRARYSAFKQVASICFLYGTLREYQEACRSFDLVVAMPFMAYQPEVLEQLPLEKLSFILNDECSLFCRRKDHYEHLSRCHLAGNSTLEEQEANIEIFGCRYRHQAGYPQLPPHGSEGKGTLFREIGMRAKEQARASGPRQNLPGGREYSITKATRTQLIRMGINHFKIQGREKLDDGFKKSVLGFLETFVRDEL